MPQAGLPLVLQQTAVMTIFTEVTLLGPNNISVTAWWQTENNQVPDEKGCNALT